MDEDFNDVKLEDHIRCWDEKISDDPDEETTVRRCYIKSIVKKDGKTFIVETARHNGEYVTWCYEQKDDPLGPRAFYTEHHHGMNHWDDIGRHRAILEERFGVPPVRRAG